MIFVKEVSRQATPINQPPPIGQTCHRGPGARSWRFRDHEASRDQVAKLIVGKEKVLRE
jgi:hypothetical protein